MPLDRAHGGPSVDRVIGILPAESERLPPYQRRESPDERRSAGDALEGDASLSRGEEHHRRSPKEIKAGSRREARHQGRSAGNTGKRPRPTTELVRGARGL